MPQDLPINSLFSGPPRYRTVTPWGPVEAMLLTLAAAVGPQLAGGLILHQMGAPATLASPLVVGLAAAAQVASIALIWIIAGRAGLRLDTLQFRQPALSWGGCIAAGLLMLALTSLLELAMWGGDAFDPLAESKMMLEGLQSPTWPAMVVVTVVLAPIWEELAFRGFLLTALAKTRLGIAGGGLITTSLWTLMHLQYSPAGMASVFLSGLFLTWLVWRTASIRACIVAHAIGNATALLFLTLLAAA